MVKIFAAKIVRWLPLLLVLSFPLLLVAAEWHYAWSVTPGGVRTIDDHLARFGMPEFVIHVKRDGDPEIYFEFSGFPRGEIPNIAMPSSRPAYVYDRSGLLVDWCIDPGDSKKWHTTWSRISEVDLDVKPLVEQLQGSKS